jgi:hypothetical protein
MSTRPAVYGIGKQVQRKSRRGREGGKEVNETKTI